MTSSRSRTSINSWLALILVCVTWIALSPSSAHAGRRRVVVLELEGPQAEDFHAGLVKLLKKKFTVVPADKWARTAEDLGASKLTSKNIKKVAKKLKIDAVVTGTIDKRRDEYILKLKVREGRSGKSVGTRIDVKAESARISGSTRRDLKDELLPVLDGVASIRGTDRDDEEEEDDEDDDKSAKKRKNDRDDDEDDGEDKPAKRRFSKRDAETVAALETKKDRKQDDEEDEEDEEDEADKEDKDDRRTKSRKKRTSSRDGDKDEDEDDEEDGVEDEVEVLTGAAAMSPGERAIELVAGVSFNARRMKFSYDADLANQPAPYNGVPVAGAMLDLSVYPLAIGHKSQGIAKNFGVTAMFDKVLKINSKQRAADGTIVVLPTSQQRWAAGVAFRHALGKLTIGGTLRYGKQDFTISPAMGETPGLPSVSYTVIDPSVTFKYMATDKIVLGLAAGFMAITDTGAIQSNMNYGAATVSGFEAELGGDYLLTTNIFARAAFRMETIGYAFKGSGMLANRDGDPEPDVFGARDNYFGGAVTLGVVY